MKNKFTIYIFMLTLISINGFIGTSLFARTHNSVFFAEPGIATITGTASVCEGVTSVVYTTESGMDNYLWRVSSGGIITTGAFTNTIKVSWITAGAQMVFVSYEDPSNSGRLASTTYDVAVSTLPENPGPMSGPKRVCMGDKNVTYSIPPIPSATDYIWMIPSGATIVAGANTNSIKVAFSFAASSGNVLVYGQNMCGDGNVSDFFPVAVHEIPSTPSISLSGEILQSSASTGNQWFFNGAIIPDATRQEYQPTENGRYCSIVTMGGCSSPFSNKIDIDLALTGINAIDDATFQVYPVPNNGTFTVKILDLDKSGLKIQVYNNMGVTVYEQNDINWDANSSFVVDLHTAAPGVYAVVVQNDKYHFVKNMLIKK